MVVAEGAMTMDRRFAARFQEAMDGAVVPPEQLQGLLSRLERFLEPFAGALNRVEQRQHCHEYLAGLVSTLERKNVESIAYLHDQERRQLQKFIGESPWDERLLVEELARQIGQTIGSPNGVLVFDPSAFAKKGTESVGVQRQWCGRLGKVENCQVGVYLAYASAQEHALVDVRLFLPEEWTRNKQRRRRAGVPKDVRFQTRHDLALAMLDAHGAVLPHRWIAGDDEMGRCTRFRRELQARGEQYLLAVPSNTRVRDLNVPPPAPTRGRWTRKAPFQRVCDWAAALPAEAWQEITVRDGEKGPITVMAVQTRVQISSERRRLELEEDLVATRERQADGTYKHDYYFGFALAETSLLEFVRVAKTEHRVEECLQRAKGEAGLADYEVRNWRGWHHHQTLALIATWFLTQESQQGKKTHACVDGSPSSLDDRPALAA
jgi:SRSO17 transposase